MEIRVICVCWNAEATIGKTIESFLSQNYEHKSLLIVDGNSTDGTVDIAKSFSEVEIVSEPDEGMYDGLNKGLAKHLSSPSTSPDGQFAIGCLNADDCYHSSNSLTQISNGLEKADIVHGHLNFVRDHDSKKVVRRWRVDRRPKRGFRAGWMPAHPTFYVRSEVAQAVGNFDLNYATASDYDWMMRAVELYGFSVARVDDVLVDMMIGGRSTDSLRSHIHHNFEALRARQKWLNAPVVDYALFAKPASKIGQFLGRGA